MWKIGWGISNLCNMRCEFCYSKKVRKDFSNSTISDVMKFLERNAKEIDSINFGTGEPSIVPEFFEICRKLKDYNPEIKIGVTTNGTLIERLNSKDGLEIFKRCIDDIDVSLDYYIPQKHDSSRGKVGAFNNAVKTLDACKIMHKNTSIVCALHKYNCSIENIDGLIRLARLYDATFRINIYRPTTSFDYVISYYDLKRIILHIVSNYSIVSISDPLFAWLLQMESSSQDPTGKSSFRILPSGRVSPSTYLLDDKWTGVDVNSANDVSQIASSETFSQIDKFKIPIACQNCEGYSMCKGGAYDRRWLWYKNYEEQDPYCPKRYNEVYWREKESHIKIISSNKGFVHDGYLPTLFFSPSLSVEECAWEKIYRENVSYLGSEEVEHFVQGFFKTMPILDGKSVLDAGSGLGRNGRWLLERGAFVTFCDISFTANDLLQERLLYSSYSKYRIIQQDYVTFMKEEKSYWDVILLLHILSHGKMEEICSTIQTAIDKLHAEGTLLCTLPSTKDYRFLNHTSSNYKSFELDDGPEKGIMHTFFDINDVYKSVGKNGEIVSINEVVSERHAHWEFVVRKV